MENHQELLNDIGEMASVSDLDNIYTAELSNEPPETLAKYNKSKYIIVFLMSCLFIVLIYVVVKK